MSERPEDHPQVPDLGKEKDSTNRIVVPIFASHDVFGLLIAIKFAGVRRQLQRGELPLTYSGWSNATFTDIQTINPSVIAFDGLTAVRSSVGLFENPGKPFALQKSTEQKPLFIIGADMMQVSEIPEVLELNGETKTEFVITVLQEYAKKHMPHLLEQKSHGPMDLDELTYKALNFRNALMAAKALDVYASLGEKVADGPIASVLGFGHGFTRENVWEDRQVREQVLRDVFIQMYETLVAVVQEGEKESGKKLLLPQVLDHFTRQLGIVFGDTTIWHLGERVDGKSISLDERERVFFLEQRLISPTVLRLIQEAEAMVISR